MAVHGGPRTRCSHATSCRCQCKYRTGQASGYMANPQTESAQGVHTVRSITKAQTQVGCDMPVAMPPHIVVRTGRTARGVSVSSRLNAHFETQRHLVHNRKEHTFYIACGCLETGIGISSRSPREPPHANGTHVGCRFQRARACACSCVCVCVHTSCVCFNARFLVVNHVNAVGRPQLLQCMYWIINCSRIRRNPICMSVRAHVAHTRPHEQ